MRDKDIKDYIEDAISEMIEVPNFQGRNIEVEGADKTTYEKLIYEHYEEVVLHKDFEKILTYIINNVPVYLLSPTGVGKTHMAEQISIALNTGYEFTSQITDEFQLLGYVDAIGDYQDTPFYRAFVNGDLFFIDEIDASIPEALIKINMALSNDMMSFPHKNLDKKDGFKVVVAGNTIEGATEEFTGRSKLDAASLNRFAIVKIDYDFEMEKKLLSNETAELFKALREFSTKKEINVDFSLRTALHFDKMYNNENNESLLDILLKDILLPFADIPDYYSMEDFEDFGIDSQNLTVQIVRGAIQRRINP